MQPLFSIIIPCYNQAIYLPDCVNSLLEQSEQSWEAIIINDGSTDNTEEVATEYFLKDNRIKYFEKKNGGLSSARNEGLRHVSGRRIIFMDSDDFFYSNCLEVVKEKLDQSPSDDYLVIKYGYSHITSDKKKVLRSVAQNSNKQLLPSLFYGNFGPPNSICVSKLLCDFAGYFDEELKSVEDWDYWLRIAKSGAQLKEINLPLVYYRYVNNSMSRNAFVMYESLLTVIERGPKKDSRIKIDSALNKDYDFNSNRVLQEVLLRSLGVSIMQGKIDQSILFFKEHSPISLNGYKVGDYEYMCSYLSFRYWYSQADIKEVFESIYPNFNLFFNRLGYNKSITNKALYHVFKSHYFHRNIFKYGKFIGSVVNFSLRNYNEKFVAYK